MSTAPGVSPWTQIESGARRSGSPLTSSTGSPLAMATHRAAMRSGSRRTAPRSERGTSRPSGVYARSAKASTAVASPAASASLIHSDPGSPSAVREESYPATAATTALACTVWVPMALYSAPCGLTYRTRSPASPCEAVECRDLVDDLLLEGVGVDVDEAAAEAGEVAVATCAPMATPPRTARSHTGRMIVGSPAWNPQATLALLTIPRRASSSPMDQLPWPSPRSELRSTVSMGSSRSGSGRRNGGGAEGALDPALITDRRRLLNNLSRAGGRLGRRLRPVRRPVVSARAS